VNRSSCAHFTTQTPTKRTICTNNESKIVLEMTCFFDRYTLQDAEWRCWSSIDLHRSAASKVKQSRMNGRRVTIHNHKLSPETHSLPRLSRRSLWDGCCCTWIHLLHSTLSLSNLQKTMSTRLPLTAVHDVRLIKRIPLTVTKKRSANSTCCFFSFSPSCTKSQTERPMNERFSYSLTVNRTPLSKGSSAHF
jgi:hypothetical protein